MLWEVLAVTGLTALVGLLVAKDPPPIFGVYRQPGPRFWIKYALFRALLWLRKAFDAVFFISCNSDGIYVVAGSERRKHNIVHGVFYVLMPGVGLLRSQKLPDTILFGAKDGVFGAEGLRLYPVEALKKWKVEFEGTMHLKDDPSKQFEVKLDGLWSSDRSIFNFDTDLHPHAIAKMIALEPWSREFFQRIQSAHQTHYEQMGHLRGSLHINSKVFNIDLMSFRDHSFGFARIWTYMHRYAFFHFFLEDGTRAVVGVISHPHNFSLMETGYVHLPDGTTHPLEWCDLQLYQHGEQGTAPLDHAFSFKAGGTVYHVKVKVEDAAVHFVGWRWEAKMVERFISCEMNGVPGRGVSEFNYANTQGRRPSAARSDPDWFAGVLKDTYSD